jgi:hypothetical protein
MDFSHTHHTFASKQWYERKLSSNCVLSASITLISSKLMLAAGQIDAIVVSDLLLVEASSDF